MRPIGLTGATCATVPAGPAEPDTLSPGTAAVPSLKFTADATAGSFTSGVGVFLIATAGPDALRDAQAVHRFQIERLALQAI